MARTKVVGGLTFKPLSRGWYRCNQTGERVSKHQIAGLVAAYHHSNKSAVPHVQKQVNASPKQHNHPSKYRSKHNG